MELMDYSNQYLLLICRKKQKNCRSPTGIPTSSSRGRAADLMRISGILYHLFISSKLLSGCCSYLDGPNKQQVIYRSPPDAGCV